MKTKNFFTKQQNYKIKILVMTVLSGILLTACGVTEKSVSKKEKQEMLKERLEAIETRRNSLNELVESYEGWKPGGTKSIKLSLLEHNIKRNKGDYEEYKGTASEAITQSQAKSLAQANAYAQFAKDIGSVVGAIAKKKGNLDKDSEGVEGSEKFNEKINQNAIISANNFLEKSFVFVKKDSDGTWAAEMMYLFDKNKDLDVVNAVLKKTLQNTKLTVKEKIWLKKLMDDLNK